MLLLDPQELEYLLEHLGHPETLKEKKFQEWLLDNDHRQLFERVRDYREAYLRVDKGEMIDLAKEWEQFEVNVQKKSGWGMRRIGVVAASGLIFLLIGMLWQPTEIETVKVVREAELIGKKSAELILANGKNINLEQINNLHEEELGISIIRDSINNQLTYQSSEIQKETTEIRYNRLVVPKGADFSFKLPDSSVVTVNSESILWFPIQFATDNRTVYLEGEAYFDVSKNENAPFKVITGDRTITVLGTKFNVCSYLDGLNWSTTLVEGKVSISNGDTHCVLKPSEQYIVDNRTGKAEVKHVNVELYTSWLNGKLHFKDYRLEDIIRKLERWYDFTIIYQEEEIKDMKFRGVIDKDRSLKETLHLLEETKTISFEIKGNIICVCKKEIQ